MFGINIRKELYNMDTINQQQAAVREVEYWRDMADALERLEQNPDFQKVILEGYFKDRAVSGVSILASDQVKDSGRRTDVMEGLIAVSALQDHFYTIKGMAASAQEFEEEMEAEEAEENAEAVGAETLEG